jgi:hypothetical protein
MHHCLAGEPSFFHAKMVGCHNDSPADKYYRYAANGKNDITRSIVQNAATPPML